MTIENIKANGIPTDKWISMEAFCSLITLKSDANFYVNDATAQYYFSSDGLMFVRHTTGKPEVIKDGIKSGYVSVEHDGDTYQLKLSKFGANDKTVGIYHDVIGLEYVASFFKNK